MVDIIIKDIEEENVELNFLKMLVAIFQVLLGFLRVVERNLFNYSVRIRENTDQKNSKYKHFSCSDRGLYRTRQSSLVELLTKSVTE